ncbi:MAG: hypothetical protein DRJ44_04720 [Thermoprotei archaeon]|nr:MAG: hypothetical protein DRJ44_04720 [Thermoprotei archaeon]
MQVILLAAIILVAIIAAVYFYMPKPVELEKEVVVYGIWAEAEGENFQKALDIFEEKTGVTVNYIPQSDIRTAIMTEFASGEVQFDIAIIPWAGLIKELARTGHIEDITPILKEEGLEEKLFKDLLEIVKVDGKYYGIPIKMSVKTLLWYNPKVFEKYGLKPPTNWDEFLGVCETLKNNGVQPLAAGGKTKWTLTEYMEAFLFGMHGPQLTFDLIEHKVEWTDPKVKETFALMADLIKKGYWGEHPEAEEGVPQFTRLGNGEVGMWLILSATNVFMSQYFGFTPGEDYDVIPWPNPNPNVPKTVAANADYVIIAKKAPHPNAAKKLAAWLGGAEYQEAMVRMKGYLAPNKDVPLNAYDPIDSKVINILNNADAIVPDLDDACPGEFQLVILSKIQEFFANPDNLDAILSEMEAEADRIYGGG